LPFFWYQTTAFEALSFTVNLREEIPCGTLCYAVYLGRIFVKGNFWISGRRT